MCRPAAIVAVPSSCALVKRACLQNSFPNQARTRREAAHVLHLPSWPMTSRPPGLSRRAISSTARDLCSTKQRTVMANTTSKL